MPSAANVNPDKFKTDRVVFDNGEFSIVWGTYTMKGAAPEKTLGIRWNGHKSDMGFPVQGKNPTWFILPAQLHKAVLDSVKGTPGYSDPE